MKPLPLPDRDFGTLAVCAVRYALGRRTYVPAEVCRILRTHLSRLSATDRAVILNDVASYHHYGDPCDYAEWKALEQALREVQP